MVCGNPPHSSSIIHYGLILLDSYEGALFDNTYAWMTRWNNQGQIVQVRAYLDSALVAKSVFENEGPTNSTFTTVRDTLEPGPGGYGILP